MASTIAPLTDKALDRRIERVLDQAAYRLSRRTITLRVAMMVRRWGFTGADVKRVGVRLRALRKRGLVSHYTSVIGSGWYTQTQFAPARERVARVAEGAGSCFGGYRG